MRQHLPWTRAPRDSALVAAALAVCVVANITASPVVAAAGSVHASPVGAGVPPEMTYQRVAAWPAGTRQPRDGTRWTVVYLGDSMAVATTADLRAELPDWNVIARNHGGTAPCDWADPDTLAELFATTRPDVVVFSFIGNSITPCTQHARGNDLLGAYRADLVSICRAAAPARCVAVGQPTLGPLVERTLPGPDEPTTTYRHHALLGHWGFIDAGGSTETITGTFDPTKRDPDGVHFSTTGASHQAATIAGYLRWLTTSPMTSR